jgi:hypothetical protein
MGIDEGAVGCAQNFDVLRIKSGVDLVQPLAPRR